MAFFFNFCLPLHPFSLECCLDEIQVFVEPLPEGEVSTAQLVLTELLPSDHLTTDVIFWTYYGGGGGREGKKREGEQV